MRKLLIAIAAAAALSATTAAPAPAAAGPCDKLPVAGCEAAGVVVETACHAAWPTLYRLGYRECPA